MIVQLRVFPLRISSGFTLRCHSSIIYLPVVPSLNFYNTRQHPVSHHHTIISSTTSRRGITYSTTSVMKRIRHSLLHALRETRLQSLGDDAVASGVRHLASLLVGAGVVDGVWDLLFDAAWGLQWY